VRDFNPFYILAVYSYVPRAYYIRGKVSVN